MLKVIFLELLGHCKGNDEINNLYRSILEQKKL